MEIIVDKSVKINPKDPKSNPDFKRAQAIGHARYGAMKFKSDAEKRDYDRAVDSNPNNVRGLPPFYPATKIRTAGGLEHNCKTSGHRWSNTQEKFCVHCFEDKP